MTKEEILDYILVNTNQYFVGMENFEIKEPVLDGLLKRALNIYGKYKPTEVVVPVLLNSTKTQLKEIEDEFGIIRPVRLVKNIYYMNYRKFPGDIKDWAKVPFVWEWDEVRKILFTSFSDNTSDFYYIEFLCAPVLEDITYQDQEFLDLILALSLIYIGHNRTDFALSELPFDIRDLRDEGQDLYEKTIEYLETSGNSGWWKALV